MECLWGPSYAQGVRDISVCAGLLVMFMTNEDGLYSGEFFKIISICKSIMYGTNVYDSCPQLLHLLVP